MNKKSKQINMRIGLDLLERFDGAACSQGKRKRSDIMQSLMLAYVKLVEKSNGRPIHTLEFKGFDPDDRPRGDWEAFKKLRIVSPEPELRGAEPQAGYGKTGRTEKVGAKSR